jgi:integrase
LVTIWLQRPEKYKKEENFVTMTAKTRIRTPKKLTNDLIESFKVGNINPLNRRKIKDGQKISDGSGLYIQISKTGKKTFRFRYRSLEDKKQTVVTLGDFDQKGDGVSSFTLEQAQAGYKKFIDLRKREKIDPKTLIEKEEESRLQEQKLSEYTFYIAANEWLQKQTDFTQGHKEKVVEAFKKNCYPIIGKKPMNTITRADIQKIADDITGRGANDTARRVISWLEKIFDDALFSGKIEADPTAGIKKRLPKAIRGKFKAVTDPAKLRDILIALDEIPGEITVRTALKLLPHIFVRQMELRLARWQDFDFKNNLWTLHKSKVKGRSIADENIDDQEKDFVIPLSSQVVALLEGLKPYTCGSELVFPGQDSITRPISNGTLNMALKRIGITETTPHGFRSTFKTLCSEVFDVPLNITEHALSHSAKSDAYGYHRGTFLPQRRALAQVWSNYIDQLKAGEPDIPSLKKQLAELTEHFKKQ